MTIKKYLFCFGLAAFLSVNYIATARGEEVTEYDYFELVDKFSLFNNCEPMKFVVDQSINLNPDVIKLGLYENAVTTLVQKRLRAARLYDEKAKWPLVYMKVGVSGKAFNVRVEFFKNLTDDISNTKELASTWQNSALGTHENDSTYVMSRVSQLIDSFIEEYLRVNASACK